MFNQRKELNTDSQVSKSKISKFSSIRKLVDKFSFYKSLSTSVIEKFNSIKQYQLPVVGLTADGFTINGFSILLNNTFSGVSNFLRLIVSLYFVAQANATEFKDFYDSFFSDESTNTSYKLSVLNMEHYFGGSLNTEQAAKYIISFCNATETNQEISNLVLIKKLERMVDHVGSVPQLVEYFWRERSDQAQYLFEQCIQLMMDQSIEQDSKGNGNWKLALEVGLPIIVGAALCCAGFMLAKKHGITCKKNKQSSESDALMTPRNAVF